jgi:hypothetical protein
VKLTPSTAFTVPNALCKSLTSIMAPLLKGSNR